MLDKKILLYTSDFKLVYKVQEATKDLFKIIHKMELDALSEQDFVITDNSHENLNGRFNVLRLDNSVDPLLLRKLIINHIYPYTNKYDIKIGIDPGYSIGIAYLHRDIEIFTDVSYTIEKTVLKIRKQIEKLKTKSIIIKIGDGATHTELLEMLIREFGKIAIIEIVNEYKTSVKSKNNRSVHEDSAVLIAKRKGTQVN